MKTIVKYTGILLIMLFSNLALGTDLYSIKSGGNFSDPTAWSLTSGGEPCDCTPTKTDNIYIEEDINLDVSFTSNALIQISQGKSIKTSDWDLTLVKGVLNVLNGNVVEVRHLIVFSSAKVYIDHTSSIIVHGNLVNMVRNDDFVVDGTLSIEGNFQNELYGLISGTGCVSSNLYTGEGETWDYVNNDIPTGSIICDGVLLPIELISFEADQVSNGIELRWSTATEINNDYFTIEKSLDGVNFIKIQDIEGAGNSNEVLNYSYVDNNPFSGTSYYRLMQTDYDGQFEYFDLLAVNMGNISKELSFNICPNPVYSEGKCLLKLNGVKSDDVVYVKVRDVLGVEFCKETIYCDSENMEIELMGSQSKLSPGMYFITATLDDKTFTSKFVVE